MSRQLKKPLTREDQEFVIELMKQYEPDLRKVIGCTLSSLPPDPDMINDILQDTYEAVCKQVDAIRAVEKKRAYLITIATRAAIQEYKRLPDTLPLDENYPLPRYKLRISTSCSPNPPHPRRGRF